MRRVAIVGAGPQGRRHGLAMTRRPLAARPLHPVLVVDRHPERAASLAGELGCAWSMQLDVRDLAAAGVDGAIVTTPPAQHLTVAASCAAANIGVLVEKPIADTMESAATIVTLARHVPVMIGHVERFNPVVVALRRALSGHTIRRIDATRVQPASADVSAETTADVVTDLMIHDLDLALFLLGATPGTAIEVRASTHSAHQASAELASGHGVVWDLRARRAGSDRIRTFVVETESARFETDLVRQSLSDGTSEAATLCAGSALEREHDAFAALVEVTPESDRAIRQACDALQLAELIRSR